MACKNFWPDPVLFWVQEVVLDRLSLSNGYKDNLRKNNIFIKIIDQVRIKVILIKLGLSEKGTKFHEIFHLEFDATTD